MKADNLENGKRIAVTHGELCLIPVTKTPSGVKAEYDTYIAAHSETGHNHVLTPQTGKLEVIENNGDRYVIIKELTKLWHDKTYDVHESVIIAPGT